MSALFRFPAVSVALTYGAVLSLAMPAAAQQPGTRIPLVAGLTLVSTLEATGQEAGGDREDVVVVDRVGADGVRYRWSYVDDGAEGSRRAQGNFARFVRAEDLEGAPRLNLVFASSDQERVPGATAFSLSKAALRQLRSEGQTRLSYAEMDDELGGLLKGIGAGLGSTRVYYRGTLSLVSPEPVLIPILLDGRRTAIPALHARGRFAQRERQIELDFFIVPDDEHPLLLKITRPAATWQVLRIDRPHPDATDPIEGALENGCRAEIPGVYFAFGAAAIRPESAPSLQTVAALLAQHPAWTLVIEGHTDSVGSTAANAALSARRADAVRVALVSSYGIAAGRLSARGLGASRPLETNATLEGRARNRRVEMARPCAASR